MNPAIVIPTYWAPNAKAQPLGEMGVYDHATPYDKPLPELETCLESLEQVRGVIRTIVLVVAPRDGQNSARARVDSICRRHPNLNIVVVGQREASAVVDAASRVVPDLDEELVSLRGYGAIHNLGLLVAAILGHDVVVFLDDDEVVLDDEFLIDAVYGLGQKTHQNIPVLAKTGFYLNREDSPYAEHERIPWSSKLWSRAHEFNQAMKATLTTTRISSAATAFGGCVALHAQIFSRVPYDPLITRGEDLDYLLNLRMLGLEMWVDNAWKVKHLPPNPPSAPSLFLQEVYRWTYEAAKLEAAADHPALKTLKSSSLEPYPGSWVSKQVIWRARRTALRRSIACKEHGDYFRILTKDCAAAQEYATNNAAKYFSLIEPWREIQATLWAESALARILLETGTPQELEERQEIPWSAFSNIPTFEEAEKTLVPEADLPVPDTTDID